MRTYVANMRRGLIGRRTSESSSPAMRIGFGARSPDCDCASGTCRPRPSSGPPGNRATPPRRRISATVHELVAQLLREEADLRHA